MSIINLSESANYGIKGNSRRNIVRWLLCYMRAFAIAKMVRCNG